MSIAYNNLDQYERQQEAQSRKVIEALGTAFVQHAKEYSPVLTGYMQSRNQFEWDGDEGVGYNDASYSGHNNYGHTTRKGTRVPGSHFFERAVDQTVKEAESIAAEALR